LSREVEKEGTERKKRSEFIFSSNKVDVRPRKKGREKKKTEEEKKTTCAYLERSVLPAEVLARGGGLVLAEGGAYKI
jgi:hypothetical protein